MEALFTSVDGREALRTRVLELIREAAALADSNKIDLHVMMFAFTDQTIADLLADVATRYTAMTIRILTDWSQRHNARGQQVGRLAKLGLPNLRVRYKSDQPYVWDVTAGHPRWSYHASRGLLHHKTLCVLVDGRPRWLICGSLNWTGAAARSYENILTVTADQPESLKLMTRIELEFEALWSDGCATLSPEEAHLHYRAIMDEYFRNPTIPSSAVRGLMHGHGENLEVVKPECWNESMRLANSGIEIAFSCCAMEEGLIRCGHAKRNQLQCLLLLSPSRRIKRVSLTLTNLALDTIYRAAPGDTLKIAMYGLSTRVPEFGALLNAARRGVRLMILLDRAVGLEVSKRFLRAARERRLPIEVRTASRTMHQKYIVNLRSGTVLTGTANMSTDASSRHLEHRIRISENPRLAAQFCADFDTIWSRLTTEKVAGAQRLLDKKEEEHAEHDPP